MKRDITESNIIAKEGRMVYTTYRCNCGSTSQCVFQAHIKDGVVVAVDPCKLSVAKDRKINFIQSDINERHTAVLRDPSV